MKLPPLILASASPRRAELLKLLQVKFRILPGDPARLLLPKGKFQADAIVKQALRDWSKQLFADIGDGIEGSPRRKWATMQNALTEVTEKEVSFEVLKRPVAGWKA